MESLKLKLFEFRKELNEEQLDIANIISEHMNICENYSEKEMLSNLNRTLESYTYYDNVKSLLESIDAELSENPLLYDLKDLYAKIKRKGDTFLYENVLNDIMHIITETNDVNRKMKIVNGLADYEWIPEVKQFLHTFSSTPQEKHNYSSDASRIDDVYSIVLQLKEGYLTYIAETWFLMNDDGVASTLLEKHVKDDVQLKKLRLLEQAINSAEFEDNTITFRIAEELTISFDTDKKEIYLNDDVAEAESTLESLFNSPLIPYAGKGYYPILNETYLNLDKFMKIDTVKRVSNLIKPTYEAYVFNYNNKLAQFIIDKRVGSSIATYEKAMPLIESILHELGADLTFFFEEMLTEEQKELSNITNKEKVLVEKLNNIEEAIFKLKDEKELIEESKTLTSLYNNLLSNKHKVAEELKVLKNNKAKLV